MHDVLVQRTSRLEYTLFVKGISAWWIVCSTSNREFQYTDGRSFRGSESDFFRAASDWSGPHIFCYSALEKCIYTSNAADTEYIARKTNVQRICE